MLETNLKEEATKKKEPKSFLIPHCIKSHRIGGLGRYIKTKPLTQRRLPRTPHIFIYTH